MYSSQLAVSAFFGAANRIWTGTVSLPRDFKSLMSAYSIIAAYKLKKLLARVVGFEPTDLSINSFQDCLLKPLGHTRKWILLNLHQNSTPILKHNCHIIINSILYIKILKISKNKF